MLYRFNREKDIAYASLLYTFIVFFFYFGMFAISGLEYYRKAVIGEFVFLLLPALLFVELGVTRNKREFLRLNKVTLSNCILIIMIIMFSLPLFGFINSVVYYIFSLIFGAIEVYSVPSPAGFRELLLSLIALALVPAVCEEFLFRGVMQGIFRRHGHIFAVLFSAGLFSLLHLDIQRVIGIWLLGSLIGYIVYRANSLYAGIIAHFAYNALTVFISYIFIETDDFSENGITRITRESYSIFTDSESATIISSIIMIIIFSTIFFFLLSRFLRKTSAVKELRIRTAFDRAAKGYLLLLPAIAFIVLLYVIQSKVIIDGFEGFLNLLLPVLRF